jgi:regulator of protease activity HflC (stomatin/prohibitin superfamily)
MLHELLKAVKLKIISKVTVYVNVTWVIGSRQIEMLIEVVVHVNVRWVIGSRHVQNIDWGNWSCSCYMRYFQSPCWNYWLR